MNHIFREVQSNDKSVNIATYINAELPIKSELVTELVKFIAKIDEVKK